MVIDVQTLQLWVTSIKSLGIPLDSSGLDFKNNFYHVQYAQISKLNVNLYVICICSAYLCTQLHKHVRKNMLTWINYHDDSSSFGKNNLQRSWKQVMATRSVTGWREMEFAWLIELAYRQACECICTRIFCQGIQRVCPQRETVAKKVTRKWTTAKRRNNIYRIKWIKLIPR